ncbi:MAG TPA: exodeoxyribonuclease VII large subunit [Candidatus Polarisedimenticolia bacterium]|jgi:exodeoxyribonuclease VII large subunit
MPDPSLPLFDAIPEPAQERSEPARPGTQTRPLTVSEVNTAAKELLEEAFPDVWIQGEISNFKAHGSGHFYFSLKDARCQVSAVMFRGPALHLRFRPADGLSVVARGRVTLYEARGSYQVNVQWMEPLGVGSLQLAFEQLKAKLKAEGLFEPGRKRPLPALPRRIAVVTSPTGAAIRDILRVLQRRHAGLAVLIAPCRVQGEGSAREIAQAIELVNEYSALGGERAIDVMIVGRGGGSIEDLWAFNEEIVARAIAASSVPTISAVGHEVDFTIADFVADLRAPTPSAAAEMVVSSRDELLSRVETGLTRLLQAVRYLLVRRRSRVDGLARSRAFARVEGTLAEARQRCDESMMRLGNALPSRLRDGRERVGLAVERLSPRSLRAEVAARRGRLSASADRLARAMSARVRSLRDRVASTEAVLASLSPLAVLDRGYAICQDPATGAVIADASSVSAGDEVRVRLARGRIGARVTSAEPGGAD